MTPYNDILSLHSKGINNSAIERELCNVTRKTIISTLQLADLYNLQYPFEHPLTDLEIHRILHPKKSREQRKPDMDEVMFQLFLPGHNINQLWNKYRIDAENAGIKPYSKSQFQNFVLEEKKRGDYREYNSTMEIKVVKDAYVSENGSKKMVLFARLVYSDYVTATVLKDNKARTWVHGLIKILHTFGGAAKTCIYLGRLPKAVLGQTIECLNYYGASFEIETSSVTKSPFGQWISNTITSLNAKDARLENSEWNILSQACLEYNNRSYVQGKKFTRMKGMDIERDYLVKLPTSDYDLIEYLDVSVQSNYHVEIDQTYYSIPFDYRREKLTAFVSDHDVEIYCEGVLLCIHKKGNGRYVTDPDHIPEDKDIPRGELSGRSLRKWARKVGPHTEHVIDAWLRSRPFEVQAYKVCNTVLHMTTKYGYEALENACEAAIVEKDFSYQFVVGRLKESK